MPNIREVDLNLLAAFDALFEARNVTRAAARLALTQPTVSGMLQRLRHAFGDELFIRTSHGVLPTPRAEALAGPIKDILIRAQALVAPADFDPMQARGTIRLAGSDYLQQAVILPLVKALRQRAPGLNVLVRPRPAGGVADLLARGEIDLVVSLPEVAAPELPSMTLFRDRYVCVARDGHPLAHTRATAAALCGFDHLLVDPTGRSLSGPVDAVLASLGHRRRVVAAVPSFHVLFDLLASGDYVAFCPQRLFRTWARGFQVIETAFQAPTLDVTAYWHERVAADARHQWLRGLLADVTALG